MRAHYLQHVPFEGLGAIEPWLKNQGYQVTRTQLFESADFPNLKDIDLLIILGGPMSVTDEDKHPWLAPEKTFIREAIEAGISVLGICLGAQLIAGSMGANVYPNSEKEIGWFPVEGATSNGSSLFHFPKSFECFHWHGETFNLPSDATLLASSEACKNQAFQIGTSVIGLQFHLEFTQTSVRDLVSHCRNELVPSDFIQSEEKILSVKPEDYHAATHLMHKVLSYLHHQR